jgi:hypothetical protein
MSLVFSDMTKRAEEKQINRSLSFINTIFQEYLFTF